MEFSDADIISQTKSWISQVVIGLNFCPFASKPFNDNRIHYTIVESAKMDFILEALVSECIRLDADQEIDTTVLILPSGWNIFRTYLDLVEIAEALLAKEGFEGKYQIASFHPKYIFAGSNENEAANYTNRSPYPMLHILREDQVEKAIQKHKDIHSIPDTNILKANDLGLAYFKALQFQ